MSILTIILLIIAWGISTLLHFMWGVWLCAKTYTSDTHTIFDILFENNSEPLGFVAFISVIPILNTILGLIFVIAFLADGTIESVNPILWICRKIFKVKYLLGKVSKEV